MSNRLHFKVGDHHEPLAYESDAFDGCFSFQAVWPFFKKEELDEHAGEMFRVLKPGARYACSEYLLTPHFDWDNEEHVRLHRSYLPTLAATQSRQACRTCIKLCAMAVSRYSKHAQIGLKKSNYITASLKIMAE